MKNPTRRNFLRGTGGLLVALPFLEGLASRGSAQAAPRKRFVSIQIPHGGAWGADMHPAQGSLTESLSYAGHTVRSGALSVAVILLLAIVPIMLMNISRFRAQEAIR